METDKLLNTGVKCSNCNEYLQIKQISKYKFDWKPCTCQPVKQEDNVNHPVTGNYKPGKQPASIEVKQVENEGSHNELCSNENKSPLFSCPHLLKPLRQESQCSYEFGKAGNRHKIYYWTEEELKDKVNKALEIERFVDQQKYIGGTPNDN